MIHNWDSNDVTYTGNDDQWNAKMHSRDSTERKRRRWALSSVDRLPLASRQLLRARPTAVSRLPAINCWCWHFPPGLIFRANDHLNSHQIVKMAADFANTNLLINQTLSTSHSGEVVGHPLTYLSALICCKTITTLPHYFITSSATPTPLQPLFIVCCDAYTWLTF